MKNKSKQNRIKKFSRRNLPANLLINLIEKKFLNQVREQKVSRGTQKKKTKIATSWINEEFRPMDYCIANTTETL